MARTMAVVAFLALSSLAAASSVDLASLAEDDACLAGEACGLHALQVGSRSVGSDKLELKHADGHLAGELIQLKAPKAGQEQPNFGALANRVRDAAQAAAGQAAQVVQDTAKAVQTVVGQQALPDFGSVIDALANVTKTTIDSSSNIVEEVIARANTVAAAANVTLPILTPQEVDSMSSSLVSRVSRVQDNSKATTEEAIADAKAKITEVIQTLNSTTLETLEDAQQAARDAAEAVANALNSTFSELPPLAQREILQVITDLTLRAEKDQAAIAVAAAEAPTKAAVAPAAEGAAHRGAAATISAMLLALAAAVSA